MVGYIHRDFSTISQILQSHNLDSRWIKPRSTIIELFWEMSEDLEILELGEDGSFDITSTQPTKQREPKKYDPNDFPSVEDVDENEVDDDEAENTPPSIDSSGAANTNSVLKDLVPGKYRTYKYGEHVYFVMKLTDGETVRDVAQNANACLITTSSDKKYTVPFPPEVKMDIRSAVSTACDDIVTIRFDLIA